MVVFKCQFRMKLFIVGIMFQVSAEWNILAFHQTLLEASGGLQLSTFTQVQFLGTNLRYYFTRIFKFHNTLYFNSTTVQSTILYILLHFLYLNSIVTSYKFHTKYNKTDGQHTK